jgi:flap endonuclease-1
MGVAISELIPRKETGLADLAGHKIALDALNTIYYFLAVIRHQMSGEPLKDHRGHITSHLSGLLYRTVKFLEVGIKPVYVFNGHYPDFKQRVVEQRRAKRAEAKRKWKEAVRKGEPAIKYAQEATRVDARIVDSSKQLLELMGVPWIHAPSEGEAQCAWMCQRGLVYATASQDYDSLLFGSSRLARHLSAVTRKEQGKDDIYAEADPELIELEEVLRSLDLTRQQLVLLGLLIGTDYNEGPEGVGPMTAMKLVKEYRTLETVLLKCQFPGRTEVTKVYEFFLNPPHTDKCQMSWNPPEAGKLLGFLVKEHDFSQERAEKAVQRLRASFQQAAVLSRASSCGQPGGNPGRIDITGTMPEGIRIDPDITEGHPGYEESGDSKIIPP